MAFWTTKAFRNQTRPSPQRTVTLKRVSDLSDAGPFCVSRVREKRKESGNRATSDLRGRKQLKQGLEVGPSQKQVTNQYCPNVS